MSILNPQAAIEAVQRLAHPADGRAAPRAQDAREKIVAEMRKAEELDSLDAKRKGER